MPVWILAVVGLGALLLLRPQAKKTVYLSPTSPTLDTGPKPKTNGNGQTDALSVLKTLLNTGTSAANGSSSGPASSPAAVDCGPKPKVPSNWASLPKTHPKRLARQKWEECKGNVYDPNGWTLK